MARLNTPTFGVAFAMFLVLVLSGCGGKRSAVSPQAPGAAIQPQLGTTENSSGVRLVEVERALEELDALAVPDGVDIQLFNELKQALKEQLEARTTGKIVCGPPIGSHNQVTDLAYTSNTGGTINLSWRYRNQGDYDQDGTVAISDITPIAMNFGRKVADYPQLEPVDGSGNGIVGIEDITPIAANFGCQVAHYAVDRGPSSEGEWTEIWLLGIENGVGPGRLRLSVTVAVTAGNYFFRVVPCDSQLNRGCESIVISVAGDPPEIVSVQPISGVTGEDMVVSATVNGAAPFAYAWDFGDGATPNESNLAEPQILLGAPGEYSASLTVTSFFGEDAYEFTLTVLSDVTYDEVEDNDSPVEANPLPGLDFTGFTGSLGPGGYDGDDTDYFKLTVAQRTPVRVRMTLDSGTGDLGLQVLGTDGTTVLGSSNTAGDEEAVICELPNAGTYYVRCQAHSGYSDYTLTASELDYDEVEDNDSTGEATALPSLDFADFTASLGPGGYDGDDEDYFKLIVTEPTLVEVTMTPGSATGDLELQVLDTDGTTLLDSASTAGDEASVMCALAGAGNYFVRCIAHSGYSDYTLSAAELDYDETEDNDTPAEANGLLPFDFSGFRGSLGEGGYDGDNVDYYQFTTDTSGSVEFTLAFDRTEGELTMDLLDTDGTTGLASSISWGAMEYISYELPAPGTYYLRCDLLARGGGLDYQLSGKGMSSLYIVFIHPQVVDKDAPTDLSAFAIGAPSSYSWTFGSGADPPSSTEEHPTVTFSEYGECTCTLEVSNSLGSDSCTFNVLVPDSSDLIVLMSSREEGDVGMPLGVTVYAYDVAHALGYLATCEIPYDAVLEPEPVTWNVGVPPGSTWEKDGFWSIVPEPLLVVPTYMFFLGDTVAVNVSPMGFPVTGAPPGSSGALFNFVFTPVSAGTTTLGFLHDTTYYIEPDAVTTRYFSEEIGEEVLIN